ncbi:hypothetical protein Tco_0979536 [Tanacetum coccineum]
MNNYEEIKVPFNVLILSNDPARIDDDGVLDVSSLDSSYVSLCVKVQGKKVKHLDQAKMEMETPRSSGVNSPPNAHT